MKSKSKKPKPLLSDKIANALTVKPRADIEDDHVFGTKPKILTRNDLSSSDEDEAAISEFRKTNVNLLSDISKKYQGEVVSWKDNSKDSESDSDIDKNFHQDSKLEEKTIAHQGSESDFSENDKPDESDEESSYAGESDDYSITRTLATQSDSNDDDDNSEGEDDDDDDENGVDISQLEEPEQENFEHMKEKNVSEEAKKGACVRNQLLIWEGLLEMRIHLQKCVNTANQLPFPNHYEVLAKCGKDEFANESNKAKMNLSKALDKLLTLQNLLLKKYPETKSITTNSTEKDQKVVPADSDEEIPSDTDNEEIPSDTEESENEQPQTKTTEKQTKKRKLTDYEKEISTSHKSFKPFRDSTIQKWNEKTRITSGKNVPTNTILQQISYILSDREKLVRKTQLKRSDYEIIGYQKEINSNEEVTDRKTQDEYIPEIFDDSDFYHQLLRELIECKSADISDPVQLSRQWIALQQMRSKMKRKVDTKATKGRKIKYVVHNQLVNFMGQEKSLSWTEESANELFSSLFGKLFEQNQVGVNVNVDGLKIN